jgi:peptide/nickel transport system permease protein
VIAYIASRLLQAIPLVLGILVLTFVLIHLAPGDPIYALAGNSGSAAYYAEMRAKFGLDRSLPEQLGIYLLNALHGDFGYSYTYSQAVFAVIADRIPATLLLMLPALALSTGLGILLGMQAAARPNGASDHAILAGTLLGAAIPGFWLGQVLVIVFAAGLGLFPVQGMTTARGTATGLPALLDLLRHLVLPVITLAMLQLAIVTRLARAGLREALAEDYARASRAKGLSGLQVLVRHALPNALLPVVTVIGIQAGTILGGAIVIETIFAWPGMGRLYLESLARLDYSVLMAILTVSATLVILSNLVADVVYASLDPRIRYA